MCQAVIAYMDCHKDTKLSELAQRMHDSGLNTCLLTWNVNKKFMSDGKHKLIKQWSKESAEYEFIVSCRPREVAWKEMLDSCGDDWEENKRKLDLAGGYVVSDDIEQFFVDAKNAGMKFTREPILPEEKEEPQAGREISNPLQAIQRHKRIRVEKLSTDALIAELLDRTKHMALVCLTTSGEQIIVFQNLQTKQIVPKIALRPTTDGYRLLIQ
jgi:hypothetical protein